MNADVNILQDEHNSSVVTQHRNNSGSKRSDVSEETITIVNEVIRDTEECSSSVDDESNAVDAVSENGNEKESTPKNPHKVLKTQLQCGSWKCKNPLCNAEDNNGMLVCSNCKSKFHYFCTNLPAYQIAQFVLVKSYRKYMCVSCVRIPEDLSLKCARGIEAEFEQVLADRNNDLRVLKEEFNSKCEVIESLETAQNTLLELTKDKDVVIHSQNEVIVNFKKSNALDTTDDKNNKCKCREVRDSDLFSLHEQYESKFEDLNNIQVEKDNLLKQIVDKDKQCDDLKKKYEVELLQKKCT